MNIKYIGGTVVDVTVENAKLQSRMTTAERTAIFGRGVPDTSVISALHDLENNQPGSSVDIVCDAMVSSGDITPQRSAEIKA